MKLDAMATVPAAVTFWLVSRVSAVVPADWMVSAVAEGLVTVVAVTVPVNVGDAERTLLPVPVLVVTPVPPLETANVPDNVTAPVVAVLGVNPVVPAENEVTPPVLAAHVAVVPLDVST